MTAPITMHDNREGYCRMLGHHLKFTYCRLCQDGLPCFKILDCWFEQLDIREFVESQYTEAEIARFLTPPKPKITTLMSLIEKAQKRARKA